MSDNTHENRSVIFINRDNTHENRSVIFINRGNTHENRFVIFINRDNAHENRSVIFIKPTDVNLELFRTPKRRQLKYDAAFMNGNKS